MKQQATQLEIDFGPEFRVARHPVPAAAKPVQTSVVDHAELRMLSAVRSAVAAAKKAMPSIILFAQAAAAVAGGFALMFFAAIIQG